MDHLLVFKLIVTPLLLWGATTASRRWGETIGGFLVGLPLTSGPISVFMALQQGLDFATAATAGSLAATAAQAMFCIAYCRLARRGWAAALAGGCVVFAAIAWLLQSLELPQAALFVIDVAAIAIALHMIPNTASRAASFQPPWWDLPVRMVLITAVVIGVTMIARHVGPSVSGVLASFPFIATILAVFAHRAVDPAAGLQVMRGMAAGLTGFAAFFFVLSLVLTRTSLPLAYLVALLCSFTVQAMTLHRVRRSVVLPAD